MLNIEQLKARFASILNGGGGAGDTPDDEVRRGEMPPTLERMAACMSHHRFSDLLNYESFDDETSLFFNADSHGFGFEIAPLPGAGEETSKVLMGMFKQQLPTNSTIQVMLYASPQVLNPIKRWATQRIRDDHLTDSPELTQNFYEQARKYEREPRSENIFRQLARRRADHLLKGRWRSMFDDEQFIIRDFRVFVSINVPGADPSDRQVRNTMNARDGIRGVLESAGIASADMEPVRLISLLHEILNVDESEISRDMIPWDENAPIKNQVVNRDTVFRIGAEGMTINDMAARSYTVQAYPKETILPYMAELIGDEFQQTMQVPAPFIICSNIRIPDQEASRGKVALKAARAIQSAESQLAKIMPELRDKAEELREAQQSIENGVDFVEVAHTILMFAPIDRVTQAENKLFSLWRAKGWRLSRDSFLQVQGLMASLPFGYDRGMAADFKTMGRIRTMSEWNAVSTLPIMAEWKGTPTPRLLLLGRRGQPMHLDLFDSGDQGNMNGAVVARSGSGKSFFLNEIAQTYVGVGGRVWIIDVGRSYERTCQVLGGQFIEFTPEANICINPFSLIPDLDADRMRLLKDIVAVAISPSRDLDDLESAWVERAIGEAWEQRGRKATMTNVAENLGKLKDQRATDLADSLFPYTAKGMYAQYFEGEATMNFKKNLVVLELEELKNKGDLQSVVMLTVMLQIQEAMYLSKGEEKSQPKLCIIDEAWDLMKGGRAADFIETGYRRARKYGGSFLTATQSVQDYQNDPAAQAAWANADWIFMLGQKPDSIRALKESGRFEINGYTEHVMKSIRTKKGVYSEIYIRSPIGEGVGRLVVDPFAEQLYSTNAKDVSRMQDLQTKVGMTVTQSIERLIEDKPRFDELTRKYGLSDKEAYQRIDQERMAAGQMRPQSGGTQ